MRYLGLVAVSVLAGCGRLAFDRAGGAAGDDAMGSDAGSDASVVDVLVGEPPQTYGQRTPMRVLASDLGDPQLSVGGLELFGEVGLVLQRQTRTGSGSTFATPPIEQTGVTPMSENTDPAITYDGTWLYFVNNNGTVKRLYRIMRSGTGDFSGPASIVPGFGAVDLDSYDLVGDSVIYYFTYSGDQLHRMEYSSAAAMFGNDTPQMATGGDATNLRFPTVSSNEQLMFCDGGTGGRQTVWWSRASKTASWTYNGVAPFQDCDAGEYLDPDISPDQERLVIRCENEVYVYDKD